MKIVYFYQYFSTPKGSWGTRVYEFAAEWVKKGHEVTVVTSVYSKSDIKAVKFIEDQVFDGVKVKVINISIDNKQPFLKRINSFFLYAITSIWFALTLKADVVIASSGPITVGIPGLIAKYLRGRKLVFETRDLWPDGAIELGVISNPLLKKLSYWFEGKCYSSSSLIVALSPGMKNYIIERNKHPYVIDVTNAANIELFSRNVIIDLPKGFLPKKYAIYTGNIGRVNNSIWLFEAALELKNMNRSDIKILMIGDGQQKGELLKKKHDFDLDNFIILDLMPKEELVGYIQNAMVSLVPLLGTPVLDTSSPNKFFESLAAGVPVIQNTKGWMRDFLEFHNVGFTIDPNNSKLLANKLIELDMETDLLTNMGERAKVVASKEFDKCYLATKMLNSLQDI